MRSLRALATRTLLLGLIGLSSGCQLVLDLLDDGAPESRGVPNPDGIGSGGSQAGGTNPNDTVAGAAGSNHIGGTGGAGSSGGVSGAGGAIEPDVSPPTIVSTSPNEDTPDVLLNVPIVVEFSEAMAPESLTLQTLTLFQGDTPDVLVEGLVTTEANIAKFIPNKPLDPRMWYTVVISSTVHDLAGNPLQNSVSWSFQTGSGDWLPAVPIRTAGPAPVELEICEDPLGDGQHAVTVWTEINGRDHSLRGRTFGWTSWSDVQLLHQQDNSGVQNPSIACGAANDAFVFWAQIGHQIHSVYRTSFSSQTWTDAERLARDGIVASAPQVAANPDQSAVAIWLESDGGTSKSIVWARYDSGGGWSPPKSLTPRKPYLEAPHVAINRPGDMVAVWTGFTGVAGNAWAASYHDGVWSQPLPLETSAFATLQPRVALSDNGDAFVGWHQHYEHGIRIVVARRSTNGWGKPEVLSPVTDKSPIQLAVDASGNALALWVSTNQDRQSVWASHFRGGVWSKPAPIDDGNNVLGRASLAMNRRGKAIAVWVSGTEDHASVWANEYDSGKWNGPEPLTDTAIAQDCSLPRVAIDDGGFGRAVWAQTRGDVSEIWGAEFR